MLYLRYNVAFTFKRYENSSNKAFYSQRVWIGFNIELAEFTWAGCLGLLGLFLRFSRYFSSDHTKTTDISFNIFDQESAIDNFRLTPCQCFDTRFGVKLHISCVKYLQEFWNTDVVSLYTAKVWHISWLHHLCFHTLNWCIF